MANFLLGRPLAELYLGPDLVGRYKGTSPEWAAASFDPLTLTPSWWLDAMDESSFTLVDSTADGGGPGRVKQWRDKSGNGKHTTVGGAVGHKRPRRVDADPIANGKPSVLALNAGSSLPSSVLNADESTTAVSVRIFELYIVTAAMTGVETQWKNDSTGWNGQYINPGTADGYQCLIAGEGNLGTPRMMGVVDASTWIASNNFAPGSYRNGSGTLRGDAAARPILQLPLSVLRFVNTSSASQNQRRILLNQDATNSARAWKGPLCEVLAFPTELSMTDRVKVEQYLLKKWGIAV